MESWKQAGQRQNPSKKVGKEPIIKVKYISSPVMVNARSASEFRAIVQQLTGKDSPAAGGRWADHAKVGGGGESSRAARVHVPVPNRMINCNEEEEEFWREISGSLACIVSRNQRTVIGSEHAR